MNITKKKATRSRKHHQHLLPTWKIPLYKSDNCTKQFLLLFFFFSTQELHSVHCEFFNQSFITKPHRIVNPRTYANHSFKSNTLKSNHKFVKDSLVVSYADIPLILTETEDVASSTCGCKTVPHISTWTILRSHSVLKYIQI